jgi:hypothetical protein
MSLSIRLPQRARFPPCISCPSAVQRQPFRLPPAGRSSLCHAAAAASRGVTAVHLGPRGKKHVTQNLLHLFF